jgi:branched-chain amino acid transport system ATP-binding protein
VSTVTGPVVSAEPAVDGATPAPLLVVEDLGYSYGAVAAVRRLSLAVNEGEIVALLGPNGAGKSTALRAISGMRRASSGRVTFAGQRVERWSSDRIARLGMALVPEGRGIFPELSVDENLRMGGYTVDAGVLPERIAEVGAVFPILAERSGQPAGTLSGGEQQQLAIARALLARPRLLVLDEMSLGLAPLVVADLYQTARAINRSGTAVLLVEQQVALALEVADRVYFIERGEVTMSGPAERFRSAGTVTRAYLGESAGGGTTGDDEDEPSIERVNVPLRSRQTRALQRLAQERGVSVGEVVASAVEKYLDGLELR